MTRYLEPRAFDPSDVQLAHGLAALFEPLLECAEEHAGAACPEGCEWTVGVDPDGAAEIRHGPNPEHSRTFERIGDVAEGECCTRTRQHHHPLEVCTWAAAVIKRARGS